MAQVSEDALVMPRLVCDTLCMHHLPCEGQSSQPSTAPSSHTHLIALRRPSKPPARASKRLQPRRRLCIQPSIQPVMPFHPITSHRLPPSLAALDRSRETQQTLQNNRALPGSRILQLATPLVLPSVCCMQRGVVQCSAGVLGGRAIAEPHMHNAQAASTRHPLVRRDGA